MTPVLTFILVIQLLSGILAGIPSKLTNLTMYLEITTWNSAKDICRGNGARLYRPDRQSKLSYGIDVLRDFVGTYGLRYNSLWIDLVTQTPEEEDYVWTDSCDPLEWAVWSPKNPNNLDINLCVQLSYTFLKSAACDDLNYVMCEGMSDETCPYEIKYGTVDTQGSGWSKTSETYQFFDACKTHCDSIIFEDFSECWAFSYNVSGNLLCEMFYGEYPSVDPVLSLPGGKLYTKRCYSVIVKHLPHIEVVNQSEIPEINCSSENTPTVLTTVQPTTSFGITTMNPGNSPEVSILDSFPYQLSATSLKTSLVSSSTTEVMLTSYSSNEGRTEYGTYEATSVLDGASVRVPTTTLQNSSSPNEVPATSTIPTPTSTSNISNIRWHNTSAIKSPSKLSTATVHTSTATVRTSTATVQTSTNDSNGTSVSMCRCRYRVRKSYNHSNFIKKILKNLTIDIRKLSRRQGKYRSAADDRISVTTIGYCGASVLVAVFMLIVFCDLTKYCVSPKLPLV